MNALISSQINCQTRLERNNSDEICVHIQDQILVLDQVCYMVRSPSHNGLNQGSGQISNPEQQCTGLGQNYNHLKAISPCSVSKMKKKALTARVKGVTVLEEIGDIWLILDSMRDLKGQSLVSLSKRFPLPC